MKHSTLDLISIAYQYFPRGMLGDEPEYERTPEVRRQREAVVLARERYDAWRSLLRGVGERFHGERFSGVSVQDLSLGILSPAGDADDRCYAAYLWLPVRGAQEESHNLLFRVSFVVPYYSLNSSCSVYTAQYYAGMKRGHGSLESRDSADLSPDEEPFATGVEEEIRRSMPGYEKMPADVGNTVVPDIRVGGHFFGEATIYDCLFSAHWR